jgi:hypothetical protein
MTRDLPYVTAPMFDAAATAIALAVDGTFGSNAGANGFSWVQRSGNWVQEWVQDRRSARPRKRPAARYKRLICGFVE